MCEVDALMASYATRRAGARRARAAASRWEREAAAADAALRAQQRAQADAARQAEAEADARAHRDIDGLAPGDEVRDRFGWHLVVRVNAKSVTVATAYSWTDTIRLDRIIETRKAAR